jgi:hypothetical protein
VGAGGVAGGSGRHDAHHRAEHGHEGDDDHEPLDGHTSLSTDPAEDLRIPPGATRNF